MNQLNKHTSLHSKICEANNEQLNKHTSLQSKICEANNQSTKQTYFFTQ